MTDRKTSTKKARAKDLPPGYRYGDAAAPIKHPPASDATGVFCTCGARMADRTVHCAPITSPGGVAV